MMTQQIGISAIDYDPFGAMILPVLSDPAELYSGSRRTSRTATLDGGCVVYDTGFTVSDKTITIETCGQHFDWLARMVRIYRLVHVSWRDGVFVAIPSRYGKKGSRAWITLDITEEMT
jgi:hypothetical protein